eukprot:CAMPEP_0113725304 /NCGR_PEP_ID=MMETSP0038_2-20120614/39656_1 /TAXON_ID=2898 /ORGANISM="Cryptomonas paramecium" /LENGTH=114 /DNA_ID=CAMNT_0000655493 /DNA_START=22 /DNA_END=362 /DNA_ORIENTATION=+ /assembly_acc=CAM_ASM_000170
MAVRYKKVKVYRHILERYLTFTVWRFGHASYRKTDLMQVDSYRIAGNELHASPAWRSALEMVISLRLEAFAQDDLLSKLIMGKWARFGMRYYMRHVLLPYALLIVAFGAVVVAG